MKIVSFALLVSVLTFAPVAPSQRAGASDHPEGRLRFTEDDLPSLAEDPAGPSEIDEMARRRGFRYARDTRRAARGDAKALKKFFDLAHDADGAAAESIQGMPTVVCRLLGDEKLAKFLAAQPVVYRMMVRSLVADEEFIRDFPQSTRLLFQREMVAWFSPNDFYAIRKVFNDELELRGSRVVRAELIEKQSGRVLCDLTPDDIGAGAEREGEAFWSPDSKRVACLSSDLSEGPGNLFSTPRLPLQKKQTAVYQQAGDTWKRVDLPLNEMPGSETDTELTDAVLGHDFIQPIRWQKPDVLLLERHQYYGKLKPMVVGGETFQTIGTLSRWYRITATITAEGKATLVWKLRKD